MGTNTLFIAELVIFDGAAVGWAAWEFWKIRPGKPPKADEPSAFSPTRNKPAPTQPELPDPPRHPEREHGPDQG